MIEFLDPNFITTFVDKNKLDIANEPYKAAKEYSPTFGYYLSSMI